ncbi:hypothetical protein PINS_up009208 [Pythium insidiosum]|nr:hypothetical protein PINS_up009208 [Pythium insidiosum]
MVDSHLEVNPDSRYPSSLPVLEACSAGLLYFIAQVAWLSLVFRNPLLIHLGWSTMMSSGDAGNYVLNQLNQPLIITENALGLRNLQPCELGYGREAMWPVLPLLEQHRQLLGDTKVRDMILSRFNSSYSKLLTMEYDRVFYGTTSRCPMNVRRYNITRTETFASLIAKQYPLYRDVTSELVAMLPALVADMDAKVGQIRIPNEYLVGTKAYPLGTATLEGPAVPFNRSALTYALIRLTTRALPDATVMRGFRDKEQCYDAIDLRYLNRTLRCFQEDLTRTEIMVSKSADRLRIFLYGNWSIGVVLNVLTAWIVLAYCGRVIRIILSTHLRDFSIWHALNISIQGPPGIVHRSQLMLIAVSTIPLLVGYHVPLDAEFMIGADDSEVGSHEVVKQILIALCLSWFLRVGVEAAVPLLTLPAPNTLSSFMLSRFRNLLLVLVFFVRMALPNQTIQHAMIELIATCMLSLAIGFLLTVCAQWVQLKPETATASRDRIASALACSNATRSMYGAVAFSPMNGWSLCAFLFEGWSLRSIEKQPVLVRDESMLLYISDTNDKVRLDSSVNLHRSSLRSHSLVRPHSL